MKRVFKGITRLERKYFKGSFHKTVWYFWIKLLLLFPLVVLGTIELLVVKLYEAVKRGRIKRSGKPDIVFSNIVAGFAGLAFPNEKTEVLAKRRAEICAQCPSAVETGLYTAIIDNRTTQIQGMKCKECGCNLSAKVRSAKDYCPLGKW